MARFEAASIQKGFYKNVASFKYTILLYSFKNDGIAKKKFIFSEKVYLLMYSKSLMSFCELGKMKCT
jgi:hypothetical protein